jgi:hypothetical protein
MFGSDILEVAIGVIFVFLLVSLVASAVREGIEGWLKSRAAYLEHGIRELLRDRGGSGLAKALYEHPLISGLYGGEYTPGPDTEKPARLANGGHLPSYLPTRNVALALMDLAARGPVSTYNSGSTATPVTAATIRANIQNIQNPAIQRVLLTALDTAHDDLDRARREVEAWYDSSMDRVSGWYKRSTQLVLFVIGCTVAVLLNVNALGIADFLYRHPTQRAAVVARAEAAAKDTLNESANYVKARAALDSLGLPTGWSNMEYHKPWQRDTVIRKDSAGVQRRVVVRRGWWKYVFSPLLGWLATGLAATLGAPFWFDLLNKVMVIRSTVKPHEKSKEEGSEDRQPKKPPVAGAPPSDETAGTNSSTTAAGGGGGGDAGAAGAGAASTAATVAISPPDAESGIEGGHTPGEVPTADEDLPQAEGGVG